jgi:hypothetical protein
MKRINQACPICQWEEETIQIRGKIFAGSGMAVFQVFAKRARKKRR